MTTEAAGAVAYFSKAAMPMAGKLLPISGTNKAFMNDAISGAAFVYGQFSVAANRSL